MSHLAAAPVLPEDAVSEFARLMRRYSYAYTASHDFAVCDSLMIEEYVLHMGTHEIRGRDEQYKPATARQYRQYPGLGFTVHDFISDGHRAALRFTEHGRSALTGVLTSWRGISLYRWDGTRLTECRVEQDYCSRSTQSTTGRMHPVPAPALDPWTTGYAEADPGTLATVESWLTSGRWLTDTAIEFDDEAHAPSARARLLAPVTTVLDIFGSGSAAAFHVRSTGFYAGGIPLPQTPAEGDQVELFATGIVRFADDRLTGHIVTDRLALCRRPHMAGGSPLGRA